MKPDLTVFDIVFDPAERRFRATCPVCGFVAVRAKREAALHYLVQHLAYEHDAEAGR